MLNREELDALTGRELLDVVTQRVGDGAELKHANLIADFRTRLDGGDTVYYWHDSRLRSLYEYYSPDNVKYRKEFAAKFPGERAAKYRAACRYYGSTGYYHYTVSEVPKEFMEGDDEAHVPTVDEFKLLTENKYFPKIWAAQQSEPKYAVGDFVLFRARSALPMENPLINMIPWPQRNGMYQMKEFAGRAGFILEVAPVQPKSAAKNSKIYKILLAGKTTPMYVEERHIKKGKLPKNR